MKSPGDFDGTGPTTFGNMMLKSLFYMSTKKTCHILSTSEAYLTCANFIYKEKNIPMSGYK